MRQCLKFFITIASLCTASCLLVLLMQGCREKTSDRQEPSASDSRQQHGWSDENIANDPVGYLEWSLEEMDRLETGLRATQLKISTLSHKTRREQIAGDATYDSWEQQFNELTDLYVNAKDKNEWPAVYQGVGFEEADLKKVVLETHKNLERTKGRRARTPAIGKKLERQTAVIKSALDELRDHRAELYDALKIARLNKAVDSLNELVLRTNEFIDRTRAAADSASIDFRAEDFQPTVRSLTEDQLLERIIDSHKAGGGE